MRGTGTNRVWVGARVGGGAVRWLLVSLMCFAALGVTAASRAQDVGAVLDEQGMARSQSHELERPMPLADAMARLRVAGAPVPLGRALDAYETYLRDWAILSERVDERCIALGASATPAMRVSLFEPSAVGRRILEESARDRDRIEDQFFEACAAATDEVGRPAVETARQARRLRRALVREVEGGESLGMFSLALDLDLLILASVGADAGARARAEAAFAPQRAELVAALDRLAQARARGRHAARSLCESRGIGVADLRGASESGPTVDPGLIEELARTRQRGVAAAALSFFSLQQRALGSVADALGGESGWRLQDLALDDLERSVMMEGDRENAARVVGLLGSSTTTPKQRECIREAWIRWRSEWISKARDLLERGRTRINEDDGSELDEAFRAYLQPFQEGRKAADAALNLALRACGAPWDGDRVERSEEERRALDRAPWSPDGIPETPGLELALRDRKESHSDGPDGTSPWTVLGLSESAATAWIGLPPMDLDALRSRLLQLDAGPAAASALDSLHAAYREQWDREVAALSPAPAWPAPRPADLKGNDADQRRRAYLDAAERVDASLMAALRTVGARKEAIDFIEAARSLGDARRESTDFQPGSAPADGGFVLNPFEAVLESPLPPAERDAALRAMLPRVASMRGPLREFRLAAAAACEYVQGEPMWCCSLRPTSASTPEQRRACAEVTDRALACVRACDAQAQAALDQACAAVGGPGAQTVVESALRCRFPRYFGDERLLSRVVHELVESMAADPEAILRLTDSLRRWSRLYVAWGTRMAEASTRRPNSSTAGAPSPGDSLASARAVAARVRGGQIQRELLDLGIERLREAVAPEVLARSRQFRALERLTGIDEPSRSTIER